MRAQERVAGGRKRELGRESRGERSSWNLVSNYWFTPQTQKSGSRQARPPTGGARIQPPEPLLLPKVCLSRNLESSRGIVMQHVDILTGISIAKQNTQLHCRIFSVQNQPFLWNCKGQPHQKYEGHNTVSYLPAVSLSSE